MLCMLSIEGIGRGRDPELHQEATDPKSPDQEAGKEVFLIHTEHNIAISLNSSSFFTFGLEIYI